MKKTRLHIIGVSIGRFKNYLDGKFSGLPQRIGINQETITIAIKDSRPRKPTKEELELLEQLDSLGAARALLNLDETINRE